MTSEPELKRPKVPPDDGNPTLPESKNDNFLQTLTVAQLLESLRDMSSSQTKTDKTEVDPRKTPEQEKLQLPESTHLQLQTAREEIDHLRNTNLQLRQEIERKDIFIQELLKKLHESQTHVSELQNRLKGATNNTVESRSNPGSPHSSPLSIPPSIPLELPPSSVPQLKVIQQPPSHAVYQRILKPFPTVAVMGVSQLKNCQNLFVEVTLVKQEDQDSDMNSVTCKGGGSPLEGEKKNLIGGQLVQRSTESQSPDCLVVVFKKLKVLTTNSQQGTDFFKLKFTLKRYVDNIFETVSNVGSVYSDPFEVFSHTLYLKDKGAKVTAQGTKRKNLSTDSLKTDIAKFLASTSKANGTKESVPMTVTTTTSPSTEVIETKS